jgi:hypothetical protein
VALAGIISPIPGDGGGAVLDQGCSVPVPLDATKTLALTLVDSAGKCKLARAYAAKPSVASLAFDSKGNLVLAGGFRDPLDFGCPDFNPVPTATQQIFVVKLDPTTGACVPGTGRSFGSGGDAVATGIAVDTATDDIYLTGTFQGTLDLGTGANPLDAGGTTEAFLARLSSLPNTWVKGYAGLGKPAVPPAGVVKVPAGVVVTATFTGFIENRPDADVGTIVTAMAFDPRGNNLWAQPICSEVTAVAADPTGVTAFVGASGPDLLVTELDPSGMSTVYRETITGTGTRQGNAIAFGAAGLYVAGTFGGWLDLPDAGFLHSAGQGDVFLLELCP